MPDFYSASGVPGTNAQGASSPIRAEFQAIEDALALLAPYTGNADKIVTVNPAGSGHSARSFLGTANQIDVTIAAGSFTLALPSAITTPGSLTVSTNLSVNGNTTLGNASSDTLTINPAAVTWANAVTHSNDHTYSGNITANGTFTANGNVTLGNAGSDTLTIAGSNVTWSNPVTHSNAQTFSGAVTVASLKTGAGSQSVASNTPLTMFVSGGVGKGYEIHGWVATANYSVRAFVSVTTAAPQIVYQESIGPLTVEISGATDIQIRQVSGGIQTIEWTYTTVA